MRPGRGRYSGFTLIELMLVSAIIGLLASIALPKFGKLILKAREAAVKARLGVLRSTLSIYYADNDGQSFNWKSCCINGKNFIILSGLTPKYIDKIPKISLPKETLIAGGRPGQFNFVESDGCLDGYDPGLWAAGYSLSGPGYSWSGGIRYIMPTGSNTVYVNSDIRDSSGRFWSTW